MLEAKLKFMSHHWTKTDMYGYVHLDFRTNRKLIVEVAAVFFT